MPSNQQPNLQAVEEQRKKDRVFKSSTMPFTDVTVVIGQKVKEGQATDKEGRTEQVLTIDGSAVTIAEVDQKVKEKMRAVKDDDGNLVGYEPTGEKELFLRVKYFEAID